MVTGRITPKGQQDYERLYFIRSQLMAVIERAKPDLVAMEGYAMGFGNAKSRSHSLGELGGILRLAIWEEGIPLLIVPPSSLKALIALNGGKKTGKPQMRRALSLYYGLNIRNNDEVDAAGLQLVGEAHAGARLLHGFTHDRMDTLDKCKRIDGRKMILPR